MSPDAIQRRKVRLINRLKEDDLCVTYENQSKKKKDCKLMVDDRKRI